MSILFLLIPLSVLLAAGFLGAFIWAVRSGQYEDTCTPAMRLLMHDNFAQLGPDADRGRGSAVTPEMDTAARAKGAASASQPACSGGPGRVRIRSLNGGNSHS